MANSYKLDLSQASLDHLISTTLSKSNLVLASAQELSLTRHSLADQLASLVDDILPSTSQSNAKGKAPQSLLEELEHLHGRLSELERTRNYVRIIEHSLELRYVSTFNSKMCQTHFVCIKQ